MRSLERGLGLGAVVAICLVAMLGSGLFVLPALAASLTGSSVWLAYLCAAILVLPAALSKAELATAMPTSGGVYVFIDRTFGPLAGTVAGLGIWLSVLLKSAFVLVGVGAYLSLVHDLPIVPVALAILAALVALNLLGVRKVGKAQVAVGLLALVALAPLVLVGAFEDHIPIRDPFLTGGALGFAEAIALIYLAFGGLTKIAAIAEEVRDPSRNLHRSILLSLGLITLGYVGVTYALTSLVPLSSLEGDLRPIYTLAVAALGPGFGVMLAIVAVITMASSANSGVLAASRFPFAMARDDLLPPIVARVAERFSTPSVAILLTGSLMAASILAFDLALIAKLASAFMVLAFMAVNLTVIILRESDSSWYHPTYRAPLYPWMQGFGLLSGLALLFVMGPVAGAAIAAMVLFGLLVYLFYGRRRTDRRGVFGSLGPRRELLEDLGAALPPSASVVVPLVGGERSAETLVEIAAALGERQRVEVLHLTSVPEQLPLGQLPGSDDAIRAIERRLGSLARRHGYDLAVDAVCTRDVVRTVHEVTAQLGCDWLVMEWRRHGPQGITLFNPLGWLINHLRCNLAMFRDAGTREVREILVLPRPGPHDALVAHAADAIARVHGARLVFARFVPDSVSPVDLQSHADYLHQVASLSSLTDRVLVVRGRDALEALAPLSAGYDLLILGARGDRRLRHSVFRTLEDRLTAAASCSVLQVRTPRQQTHAVFRQHDSVPPEASAPVSSLLVPACVDLRLECRSKSELYALFGRRFTLALGLTDVQVVERALWARERTQNTAVGNGVALPHATVPGIPSTRLGVFLTASPIDYDAPDGRRVDAFFVTIGPPSDRQSHLRLLADLAHMILNTPLLERLRAADDPRDILAEIERLQR
ncbi:MAG: amino acid permease [Myxococcales bacterium]|nr:amino acid permease [Myxococcales bacterium]